MSESSAGARLLHWLVLVVLIVVILEGGAFAVGKVLQSKCAMWWPPDVVHSNADEGEIYAKYLSERHPVIGWPWTSQIGKDLTLFGANPDPAFPGAIQEDACVAVYGDSFTQGGDSSSPSTRWASQLSVLLGCYVANYGMGGYGTDQAYLRFEEHEDPRPSIAVLGIHTENVLRNLTRNRDLIAYERWYALKPRFALSESRQLFLVPLPELTHQEYLRSIGVERPFLPMEHESFQPDGPAGVVALRFPFTVAVVRNLLHFHGFRARLERRPEWTYYWAEDSEFDGLDITLGIWGLFATTARARGIEPLLLVLPHPEDFYYFQRTRVWPYQPLLDRLEAESVRYADFGPVLLDEAVSSGIPLSDFFGPTRHYNDRGNSLVSRFVQSRLEQTAILDAARGGM